MLEFLFEPIVNVYYFGCPDNCIVDFTQKRPDTSLKEAVEIFLMPITFLLISAGATFGFLYATNRLNILSRFRDPMKKMIEKSKKNKEPKSIKELEQAIRKEKKQEFLDLNDDLKDDPFTKFVEMQSPEHPLTANLEAVRTEAKEQEIIVPEQKLITENAEKEKLDLEEQAKKVAKLMEEDGLTEDEAVEKVITDSIPVTPVTPKAEPRDDIRFAEKDIFKQDRKPKKSKLPKSLQKIQKHYAKKEKKVYKWTLNALGIERRNEYADQIELKLNNWTFPLRKYNGKNQDFQKEEGEIKSDLKNFALFLSMGELMKDRDKKKRMYWEKVLVATQ